MKNKLPLIIILILVITPLNVYSKSGCCSWHGGVAGCRNGRQVCKDGTLSPTCTCYSPSNNTNSVFESDTDGYTCIMGLKKNETYKLENDFCKAIIEVLIKIFPYAFYFAFSPIYIMYVMIRCLFMRIRFKFR